MFPFTIGLATFLGRARHFHIGGRAREAQRLIERCASMFPYRTHCHSPFRMRFRSTFRGCEHPIWTTKTLQSASKMHSERLVRPSKLFVWEGVNLFRARSSGTVTVTVALFKWFDGSVTVWRPKTSRIFSILRHGVMYLGVCVVLRVVCVHSFQPCSGSCILEC